MSVPCHLNNMSAATPSEGTALAPSAEMMRAHVERFERSTDQAQRAFDALSQRVCELKRELDETNRKLREKVSELDSVNRHHRSLLDHLAEGVVGLDSDGIIRFYNPAAERMTGRCGAEWIGQPATHWLPHSNDLQRILREALQGRTQSPRISFCIDRCNMKPLPVAASASAVRNRSQQVIGVLLVLYDRSEVSDLRQEVRRNDGLAEIGRMASVVAHEIRNPLGGIEGFASLMMDDLRGQPAQKHAELILSGVQDLNRIVTSLLEYGKSEALETSEFDLNHLLADLVTLVRADKSRHHEQLKVLYRNDAPELRVHSDPVALRQVILNLVRNGVEAVTSSKSPEVRVRVERASIRGRDAVAVNINDNGPGVPPEVRATLFQPFITTKSKGTGLGLSTVRKLVNGLGGDVRLLENGSTGATFRVTLPLRNDF